jgi:vesicle coat complex subunit
MPYEDIIAAIRTTDERGALYSGIEALQEALYKTDADIITSIDTEMPHAVVKPLKQALSKLPDTSPDAIKEFLENMRTALEKASVLTLELAFEPTEETLSVLHMWIQQNLSRTIIMDVSTDRTLLGGARVSFGGRYKEINLATLVANELALRRASIEALLTFPN